MKNILFSKKISRDNQASYLNGWQKALKTYEEVMEEELKVKLGIHELQTLQILQEVKEV